MMTFIPGIVAYSCSYFIVVIETISVIGGYRSKPVTSRLICLAKQNVRSRDHDGLKADRPNARLHSSEGRTPALCTRCSVPNGASGLFNQKNDQSAPALEKNW